MIRNPARPEPGFFKLRLVKGGPWVPASITRPCTCTIGGDRPPHEWKETCDRFPTLAGEINREEGDIYQIWAYGREISEDEYNHLTALCEWAEKHAPHEPEANPYQAIDPMSMAIPQF